MPRASEGAGERSRILLREFRKRRQPKRCDSLPCLQVVPASRQLYVCLRCRFANAICRICPWCLSTCDAAAQVAVSVVRRQLSSPLLLTDAQKMQLAKIERAATARPGGRPSSARGAGALSHEAEETSSTARRATRDLPGGVCEAETGDSLRRRHRNAALYSATDVVATATEDTTLQPFLDQFAAARSEGRSLPTPEPLLTIPPPSRRATRLDSPRTSRPRTPASPTSPRSRARMSNRDAAITDTSEPTSSDASAHSSTLSRSPTAPCLRRKRRMSGLRKRSSCSLRRRTNSSAGSCRRETAAFTSPPSSPISKTETTATSLPGSPQPKKAKSIRFSTDSHLRPSPAPSPAPAPAPASSPAPAPVLVHEQFPLGHPQRPLYTAIRKNMSVASSASRPGSPAPSAATSASFDLHVYEHPARGTRSLDIDDEYAHGRPPALRYGSLTRASHLAIAYAARPALAGGFSVSGETEMRMDLARSRSMDGVPGDFAFREGKGRKGAGVLEASVRAKVKSLSKTLKSLLRVKS
ncbi:hypothetical protein DICSQDRAFT_152954 [Dichomitus squalens LYAD-421 SS1]|uniref:uncharacterized protein n=1 Tax=Dichomitus squalens (strain LYAD-421) TaxID=732165 RepID=UPI0004413B76|nr:uncharacterized protein DICSQDRAFT_152954 [Dichomitus squalens LYAD-421 SS1]EJF64729.1 hypothetical protein DICSQDRAFT_152954 [Dichomitus squalens LYAD-421 SS1]